MKLDFKKWIYTEVGTSTSCVAVFSRPFLSGSVEREWPSLWGDDEKEEKHEKHKHKHKKKD